MAEIIAHMAHRGWIPFFLPRAVGAKMNGTRIIEALIISIISAFGSYQILQNELAHQKEDINEIKTLIGKLHPIKP